MVAVACWHLNPRETDAARPAFVSGRSTACTPLETDDLTFSSFRRLIGDVPLLLYHGTATFLGGDSYENYNTAPTRLLHVAVLLLVLVLSSTCNCCAS